MKKRKSRPAKPRPILPVDAGARPGSLNALATLPPAVETVRAHYLDGLRTDNLLDGLIGTGGGPSGGGWTNPVTGHGTFNRDKVMQGSYQESFRISDPELSALYNGNDLAKRVVETVPKEMFRRGWILVVPTEDKDPEGELDAAAPGDGQNALEQPAGGESGPAAPGSPLVDPMGAAPEKPDGKTAATGGDADPPQDGAKVAPAANGATTPDDPMGENLAKPPQGTPGGGDAPEPKDDKSATLPGPQDASGALGGREPSEGKVPMRPGSDPKPAPGAKGPPGAKKPGAKDEQAVGDQGKSANLAIAAEAYGARLSLKARALEASIFGRLYGGGILIVGADDGQDMALPLDETKISTIRYLAWVDRRFVFASSWYSEIGPKYGEVRTWQVVNPFGGQSNTVVHESRVVRFDGAPVDFLMRRRLLGWTLSTLQAPYDTLRQFDLSFQSISNLMADLSQGVMKINGLAQLISNDQATLQTRMAMVDISRSSARMLYLDAENEEFERVPTPLTGVADTLQMQMLRTAAAAEQPVAILFGREPSGLNATGDADFRRFYDKTAGEQRTDLEPKLRRLYTLIFAAKDGPTGGQVPSKALEFVWHKLYEPSEKEQSEIRLNMAQADDYYIANGTLLPEEVAMSRFRSGDLHLDTEIRTDLREESLASAELAPSGAAKAQQEAEQAKDLALTTAAAKGGAGGPPGAPGAKPGGPPGAGAKGPGKVPGGAKAPPAKVPPRK